MRTEHPISNEVCLFYQVLFVVLKLTDAITWDWLWVFAPMWIPMLAILILKIILIIKKWIK